MFAFFKRSANRPAVSGISGVDAVSGVKSSQLVLIDVREAAELAKTGRAKGALHIPLMSLHTAADPAGANFQPGLDIEKPVVVYCASGMRSGKAGKILSGLGYQKVHNLGALSNWTAAGGRIAR